MPVMPEAPQPPTLFDWLAGRFPAAKRQTLKRMAESGRVVVNGKPASKLKHPLAPDDRVEVRDRPDAPQPPPKLPFRVVYEDADVLVVDKPAGLLTSTTPREPRPTLWAAVQAYVAAREPRARVGLVHRLDRDAAGLLVFSKNDAAYRALKTQFYHHTVERTYLAVVEGIPDPPKGRIETRLVERADGVVYSTKMIGKGQEAETDYEVIQVNEQAGRSLVRVALHTGRKHQIRVHLSERGTPIVGDSVYGKPQSKPARGGAGPNERLLLAAVRLAIDHPRTGERLTFELPPPRGFQV